MKKLIILSFVFVVILGVFFTLNLKVAPTITYFPIDYGTSFKSASTDLTSTLNQTDYKITWEVLSESEVPMYLRQDISLLFGDGELKGMRSQWRENTDLIRYSEEITDNHNQKWEAITFHYGEIHSGDDINSIQQMTANKLYVFHDGASFQSFQDAVGNKQSEYQASKDAKVMKKLLEHWQDLITHFHININEYHSIPLTDLANYQQKPFPTINQEKPIVLLDNYGKGSIKTTYYLI
ncbi:hypothetical protein [Ornithinibacillus scapharcae]|uniref:hypothetical protein n=1 Tax=Ornithinibacillus scapharcae TaxID=1147159 RepID=UPI000225B0FD|nr:hypothetical protein [Ornithinibacillus scapharcae]